MEDILDIYHLPYDPEYPVVCMDEANKQLIGEVKKPMPMKQGCVRLEDDEYVRNGVVQIFAEIEPLTGRQHVKINDTRTMKDWAEYMKEMADERYPEVKKIRLVMDNLNTHTIASFYETYEPEEARRLAEKFEIHYTPKHGSWLNIAEIELSVLKRQCLDRRIPSKEEMVAEVEAWLADRNKKIQKIDWQFTCDKARIKLKRLYPVIITQV
jgi:transposase